MTTNPKKKFSSESLEATDRLLKAVKEKFCGDNPQYSAIIETCRQIKANENVASESSADKFSFGYVYLLKSGNAYKIGKANHTGRRHYEIGIQLPEKCELIHEIKTDDPFGIEKYWHDRFKDKWKNGEWFDLTSDDVKAFKRRTFQ